MPSALQGGKMLDPTVWFQISGKFRVAARLPEGMTGIEALKTLNIREPEWAERMGEEHAGDHYLRCSGQQAKELTQDEWTAFKAAGGTTYLSYAYDKRKTKAARIVEKMVQKGLIGPQMADAVERVLMKEYR